jgi:acetyl esterase/lipase
MFTGCWLSPFLKQLLGSRLSIGLALFVSFPLLACGQGDPEEFKIWPGGLPNDAVQLDQRRIEEAIQKQKESAEGHIFFVDSPMLTYFPADPAVATGASVIICPGGGYHLLAWRHEGVDIAEWFNSIGVSAFVLKYRVPRRDPDRVYWEPLQDIQRSIRLVRHRSQEFGLDPNRVGVLGFSAGGHLTVMAGLQAALETYPPVDEADQISCRPDFICPIYAAYLAQGNKDNEAKLGPLVVVTPDSPPTFMAVTWDDEFRAAQAALLFVELKKKGVPAELHAFSTGGHGYGIRQTGNPVSQWHLLLESWLRVSGFLESKVDIDFRHQETPVP